MDPLENLTAADPNCLRQIRNVDWLKLSTHLQASSGFGHRCGFRLASWFWVLMRCVALARPSASLQICRCCVDWTVAALFFFALLVVMFVYLSKRRVDWQVSFSLDNATIIQTTSNYTLIEECSLLPDQAFEVDQAWASAVGEKLAVSLQEDWLVSKHKYTWTSWTWK